MISLNQAVTLLTDQHKKFIEANYHIRDSSLINERRAVMDRNEIYSQAWIEATPSYLIDKKWNELGLPQEVSDILSELDKAGLEVYDPPYRHQAEALKAFFNENKNIIVSTGTGSGKTEIFLYSILGNLALEGSREVSTASRGVRALILYPMNALVSDQLSRLRQLFGSSAGSMALQNRMDRIIQFGMLTGRTPYHGRYDSSRNDREVKPIIDYYCDLEEHDTDLYQELKSRGRIPIKNLTGFRNSHKPRTTQFRTQSSDIELFTRQEMYDPDNVYGGTPDILITNYSMLEYMLLRPIEQSLFSDTKRWLKSDPRNQLLIVLDEAHLYRGAQGAEVALLLNRLLQRLDVNRSRIRFILTSASLGNEQKVRKVAPTFASDLTGATVDDFEVITGAKEKLEEGKKGDIVLANLLKNLQYQIDVSAIKRLKDNQGWDNFNIESTNYKEYLFRNLQKMSTFRLMHNKLSDGPVTLQSLSKQLFDINDTQLAIEATGNLLHLGSVATGPANRTLLSSRLHMFFKGLPSLYVCINPKCTERLVSNTSSILGRIFTEPRQSCPCGGRVFELLTHRTCGAAYLRAFRHREESNFELSFLWTERYNSRALEEVHLLLEEPRSDPDPTSGLSLMETTSYRFLNIKTGHLIKNIPKGRELDYLKVWIPGPKEAPRNFGEPWTWSRCPACGIRERRRAGGRTNIMDLETKGEETFANLIRNTFEIQPADSKKTELPNKGRKLLCFSDGRQKAAKLARDLQLIVERDSFREVVVDIFRSLPADSSINSLFPAFLVYAKKHRIGFFNDSDQIRSTEGTGYEGSRTAFENLLEDLDNELVKFNLVNIDDLITNHHAIRELNKRRPHQFNSYLLRLLGNEYFSISAVLVGYVKPLNFIEEKIITLTPSIKSDIIREILLESIQNALEEEAFDDVITSFQRRNARSYTTERKGGEGLSYGEILPDYLKEKVGSIVPEKSWNELLRNMLFPTDLEEGLFVALPTGRYVVNSRFVTLQLGLDQNWYECNGCHQFSAWSVQGVCRKEGCNGKMQRVRNEDLHMIAKYSYLRDPCKDILQNLRTPFTLRSEEHSAQLSNKDKSEVFAKTEKYELLFQDVSISSERFDQPIDVLSSTTTMEVGIDIGSLTAVGMRTIPPRPENYQQRAGRSGRRGTGLSTIISFADNSPHETYMFKNPNKMIGASASEPVIYIGNRKIAERHINASLIEEYFDPSDMPITASVFSSLGSGRDFFTGSGRYSLSDFINWQNNQLNEGKLSKKLGELLPEKLKESISTREEDWKTAFIETTSKKLIKSLNSLKNSIDWTRQSGDDDLVAILVDAAILPTFSFPVDVCNFVVREAVQQGNSTVIKTRYEMNMGMKEALSEYIPGRQVVVDKKTFTSYGLYFRFPSNPVDRAKDSGLESMGYVNFCPYCDTVYSESDISLHDQGRVCEVCGRGIIESHHIYKPEGFSPRVRPAGQAEEGEEWEQERVYATNAKFPIHSKGNTNSPVEEKRLGISKLQRMSNQQLRVINFGLENSGFSVCTKCGAVAREGSLTNPHDRPYPRDFRVRNVTWPEQCSGSTLNATFGFEFPSDLAILRIPLLKSFDYAPGTDWFKAAAQSAVEALVLASSRTLGIDSTELSGGFRTSPREVKDFIDISGYLELFLYDTTSGGAGFATKAYERFEEIIEDASNILGGCTCTHSCYSCLRTYQNKIWHLKLDRHLGNSILHYAISGEILGIKPSNISRLNDLLRSTMTMIEPGIEFSNNLSEEHQQISMNGRQVSYVLIPALAKQPLMPNSEGSCFSDFEVDNELPKVAYTILSQLNDTRGS